ncbi:MAG TPA: restriction endonuclease subunit S [Candidatus Rothia avicola]|uniref:Restriction endonuclease subunit S n=1 Tax=Candidatus Rothia avicola TaxID=2840478 RepID=A0A9D2CQL9_9MICC|nr:restriction endonuclease subunit S [Candidatus Rothia avicola]
MKIPDWLHHIPSHWEIRKASHILDISVGGTPPTSNPEFFDGDIPWVTIADMNSDEIFGSSHYLSESGLRHANIRWSEPGDLLYSFKLSIGKTCFVKNPVVTNEAIATIHKSSKIHLPFARYVLPLAFEHAAGTNIYGAKILNQQQLKSALIPLPPLDEQKKIADELDRELAEIDEFIADQIKLKELLKEQLEAQKEQIILEAGGQQVRLSRVLKGLKDGSHGTHPRVDSGGEVLLSAKNISSGELVISEDESRISLEEAAQITASGFPRKGDVMMILVGATYGRTALYDLEQTLPFQRSVGFFRPNEELITSDYLKLVMSSREFQQQLSLGIKTSAQPGIYLSDVSSRTIKLPTLKNQLSATKHFTTLNKDYSNLGNNINQAINLLKERNKSTMQTQIIHKYHTLISKYQ